MKGLTTTIKDADNPRGNMQSKEYQKTHIARCLMTFRSIREAVQSTSGAQGYGHKHSEVDASVDISRVAELLVKDNVMIHIQGRSQSGPQGGKVDVLSAIDSFDKGCQAILHGRNVSEAIQRRQKAPIPDVALAAYDDPEAFMKEPEGGWFDWEELEKRTIGTLADESRQESSDDDDEDGIRGRDWRMVW
ncbi:hypothetical protein FN846DRAFT_886376 [Sphaerosporella brunnea]|uniref:Uncharacterized protein n=1 Tax=Sphaerosporella brunnea TaxID=1250544 RepID=A0A5J5FAA5_9PEZI|nr:hypothetical protein FN846DRAFT_886376 [Sphaerosporella brunnea]